MPKILHRIVALLLAPCLLADPATLLALNNPLVCVECERASLKGQVSSLFSVQALAPELATEQNPSKSPSAKLAEIHSVTSHVPPPVEPGRIFRPADLRSYGIPQPEELIADFAKKPKSRVWSKFLHFIRSVVNLADRLLARLENVGTTFVKDDPSRRPPPGAPPASDRRHELLWPLPESSARAMPPAIFAAVKEHFEGLKAAGETLPVYARSLGEPDAQKFGSAMEAVLEPARAVVEAMNRDGAAALGFSEPLENYFRNVGGRNFKPEDVETSPRVKEMVLRMRYPDWEMNAEFRRWLWRAWLDDQPEPFGIPWLTKRILKDIALTVETGVSPEVAHQKFGDLIAWAELLQYKGFCWFDAYQAMPQVGASIAVTAGLPWPSTAAILAHAISRFLIQGMQPEYHRPPHFDRGTGPVDWMVGGIEALVDDWLRTGAKLPSTDPERNIFTRLARLALPATAKEQTWPIEAEVDEIVRHKIAGHARFFWTGTALGSLALVLARQALHVEAGSQSPDHAYEMAGYALFAIAEEDPFQPLEGAIRLMHEAIKRFEVGMRVNPAIRAA